MTADVETECRLVGGVGDEGIVGTFMLSRVPRIGEHVRLGVLYLVNAVEWEPFCGSEPHVRQKVTLFLEKLGT